MFLVFRNACCNYTLYKSLLSIGLVFEKLSRFFLLTLGKQCATLVAGLGGAGDGEAMTVGEKVLRFRRKMGWNQEQFAAAAGLRRGHVSLIETGARRPNAATAQKLARAMGLRQWWRLCMEKTDGRGERNRQGHAGARGCADV